MDVQIDGEPFGDRVAQQIDRSLPFAEERRDAAAFEQRPGPRLPPEDPYRRYLGELFRDGPRLVEIAGPRCELSDVGRVTDLVRILGQQRRVDAEGILPSFRQVERAAKCNPMLTTGCDITRATLQPFKGSSRDLQ